MNIDFSTLEEMIIQAEQHDLWLHSFYQDLWFSPAELREQNAKGCFRWGPVNWELRSPKEHLEQAERAIEGAKASRDRIAERMKNQ